MIALVKDPPFDSDDDPIEALSCALVEALPALAELPKFIRSIAGQPSIETAKGALRVLREGRGTVIEVSLPGPNGNYSFPYQFYEYTMSTDDELVCGLTATIENLDQAMDLFKNPSLEWRELQDFELEPSLIGEILGQALVEGKLQFA